MSEAKSGARKPGGKARKAFRREEDQRQHFLGESYGNAALAPFTPPSPPVAVGRETEHNCPRQLSVTPSCRACGAPLLPESSNVADGCPCNAPRGVNHGLVSTVTCTCKECDPAQTGSSRLGSAAPPAPQGETEAAILERTGRKILGTHPGPPCKHERLQTNNGYQIFCRDCRLATWCCTDHNIDGGCGGKCSLPQGQDWQVPVAAAPPPCSRCSASTSRSQTR